MKEETGRRAPWDAAGMSRGLSVGGVCVRFGTMSHNPLSHPSGPARRPRRLRGTAAMRDLVRENALRECDLILPLFVSEKVAEPRAVATMPGVWQQTLE